MPWLSWRSNHWCALKSYWCVLRREFSGMIHWLTINNHPIPIHSHPFPTLRLAPVRNAALEKKDKNKTPRAARITHIIFFADQIVRLASHKKNHRHFAHRKVELLADTDGAKSSKALSITVKCCIGRTPSL